MCQMTHSFFFVFMVNSILFSLNFLYLSGFSFFLNFFIFMIVIVNILEFLGFLILQGYCFVKLIYKGGLFFYEW